MRELASRGRARVAALSLTLLVGLGGAGGALVLFGYLAEAVVEGEVEWWDASLLTALAASASPTLDRLAWAFSLLGSEALAALLVVLCVLFALRRQWGAAVSLLIVVVGSQLLNNLLKATFHRTRPAPLTGLIPAQEFSFPSGHAMVAAAFYLYLAFLAWRHVSGWRRVVTTAGLLLVVLLVGFSRLYLGVHYLSDVVAGYVAGFLWTASVIASSRLLRSRRDRELSRL